LVSLQAEGHRPPFFCTAGLGGDPRNLSLLADYLSPEQPLYGLQHRGTDGRQAPHTRVEDQAREFIEHMRVVQPNGPYYIGGYSIGGIITFEMARQLQAAGETVGLLALLDSPPPRMRRRDRSERLEIHWQRFRDGGGILYASGRIRDRMRREWRQFRRLARRPLTRAFPQRYVGDQMRQAWTTCRQNYEGNAYPGSAVLLRVQGNPTVMATEFVHEDDYGWHSVVDGPVEVVPIPCQHLTLWQEPFVAVLAQRLDQLLRSVQAQA
jgi:thioesterase domain-containing protein